MPSMSGTTSEGMENVAAVGSYIAFAEWWQWEAPIYWTITATMGDGRVVSKVTGQFTGDCASSSSISTGSTSFDQEYGHGVSKLVYTSMYDYIDNQCYSESP